MYDSEYDVDPDSHVFSHINDKCEYCKEEQFKDNSELMTHFRWQTLIVKVFMQTSPRLMNI